MSIIQGWNDSLKHIQDEIAELWLDRHVWRSIRQMVMQVPAARDSFIVAWIGQQYYRRAALTVRALADRNPDSDSLFNLLDGICRNPASFTCSLSMQEMCAPGLNTVDPALVAADIDALATAVAQVRPYVNKYLAHLDRSPKVPIPAISEVDDAVQLLGEMLHKYTLLITGSDLEVEPKILFDWTAGLREPWLSDPAPRQLDLSQYRA